MRIERSVGIGAVCAWVMLCVVVCASMPALGDTGEKSGKRVVVLLEMQKLEGKVVAPLLKSDSGARRGYSVSRWTGESWAEGKKSERVRLRMVYSEKGAKVGVAELAPGKYRIVFKGSILEKYACDVEFEVAAPRNGKTVRIPILHKRKIIHDGTLTVVTKLGTPYHGSVGVDQVVMVRTGPAGGMGRPETRFAVENGKPARLGFADGVKEITFQIIRYAYRTEQARPLKRTFSSDELIKGAVWEIKEQPIMAKGQVFIQTPSGVVPFTEAAVAKHCREATRGRYMRMGTFSKGAKAYGLRRSRDQGHIDMADGTLVYRYLRQEETYRIGKYQEGLTQRLVILSGSGREFARGDGVVDLGKIVVAPGKDPQFSGYVFGPAGKPAKGAMLRILDSDVGTRTAAICDSNGAFSVSLAKGKYDVVVMGRGFYPVLWKLEIHKNATKKFVLKSLPKLVVSAKGFKPGPRVINVKLFSGDKAGPVAEGYIGEKANMVITGIPAGEYLLVSVGYPRNVKGFDSVQFDTITFAKTLVSIHDGRDNRVEIALRPGRSIGVTPVQAKPQVLRKGGVAVLWGLWKKSKFMLPAGRIDAEGLGTVVVAWPGQYVMEVVIPKKDGDEKWKYADAYYCEAMEIKKTDQKVQYRLKKETKHRFHPSSCPPSEKAAADKRKEVSSGQKP